MEQSLYPTTGWQIREEDNIQVDKDHVLVWPDTSSTFRTTDELHVKMFRADTETIRMPDYPLFLSFAAVVAITDTTITVRAFDVNPIFADGGAVKVQRNHLIDRELIFEQMWLQVRNYQPHEDGAQTWEIVTSSGKITGADQAMAFYYGVQGGNFYEATGKSPCRE